LPTKALFTTPLNAGPEKLQGNIGGIWFADRVNHER
jgi:hypothetical protein